MLDYVKRTIQLLLRYDLIVFVPWETLNFIKEHILEQECAYPKFGFIINKSNQHIEEQEVENIAKCAALCEYDPRCKFWSFSGSYHSSF